jgi:hypothetical protein
MGSFSGTPAIQAANNVEPKASVTATEENSSIEIDATVLKASSIATITQVDGRYLPFYYLKRDHTLTYS